MPITRRVLKGEKIPHQEKVFALFEPHTAWINKGKAGVPVELGVRVGLLEDELGFILHSQVMQKIADEQVAIPMIEAAKEKFPRLATLSFDKGFHRPNNQQELKSRLDCGQCCRARANVRKNNANTNKVKHSNAPDTTIRQSNRRSTPCRCTAWTSVPTTASTDSSVTSAWRYYPATGNNKELLRQRDEFIFHYNND